MTRSTDLWQRRKGRWRSIARAVLLGVAAGLAVGALFAAIWPRTYAASARVMIATPEWNDSTASASAEQLATTYGDQFTQQRMPTYLELATTARVLTPAAQDVGMSAPELGSRVSVRLIPDTVLVEVTARDGDPQSAADQANAVARRLADTIRELERSTPSAVSPVQPVLVNGATAAAKATSPNVLALLASGAGIGAAIGVSYCAVRRRGQTVISSGPEGLRMGALPVLGVLGVAAEFDAECRARVAGALDARPRLGSADTLTVVPVDAECDVQAAVESLGAAFARTGCRVGVVDVTGRGAQHRGVREVAGGGTVTTLGDEERTAEVPDYLASAAFRERLRAADEQFDCVLIVTQPAGQGASPLDASRLTTATVLATGPACAAADLAAAQTDLAHCGVEVLGVLLVDKGGDG